MVQYGDRKATSSGPETVLAEIAVLVPNSVEATNEAAQQQLERHFHRLRASQQRMAFQWLQCYRSRERPP